MLAKYIGFYILMGIISAVIFAWWDPYYGNDTIFTGMVAIFWPVFLLPFIFGSISVLIYRTINGKLEDRATKKRKERCAKKREETRAMLAEEIRGKYR